MRLGRILLLVILAGLVGCRTMPPTPKAPELSGDQILSRMKTRRGDLTAFSARGRLTLISPQQNATGTALIKGKLPQNLKVDLKGPLGRSILSFATDGYVVELLFPQEKKLFRGPATPNNLASFIPPGVKLYQALQLLVGDLPLSQGPPARVQFKPGERMYILEWLKSDGSLQERLWVVADEVQPRKEEWYEANGRLAFSAELGEFNRLAPGRPAQLKVLTSNPQVELRLAYQEFTPKISLTAADLVVPRPTGTAVLPLKP